MTTKQIISMKNKQKITVLTAYDFQIANILDEEMIDMILVGDSLGNVMLGYDNSTYVTMEHMIHHSAAVARGAKNALVIADMPFLSYHMGKEQTVRNAGRLIQEGLAQGVKLEGGSEVQEAVTAIIDAGIPVMGHLGLQPQSVNKLGGFSMQGKTEEEGERILRDAKLLESLGVFSIVLECVPPQLAQRISQEITIPTIGIGAGSQCDGQVLVINDMIGLYHKASPKFAKVYANVSEEIRKAVRQYIVDVRGE